MFAQQKQQNKLQQTVKVDPKVIQTAEMLQMNALELEDKVMQELENNPALERLEEDAIPAEAKELPDYYLHKPVMVNYDDREYSHNVIFNPDDENDWVNRIASPVSLQEHLRTQLFAIAPKELHALAEYVVEAVNASGYLDMEPEEIALYASASFDDVETIVALLKTLDPPGVGAQSLQECLLLQVKASKHFYSATAETIIQNLFDEFVKRDFKRIARKLKVPAAVVQKACDFILTLNPKPGESFRSDYDNKLPVNSINVKPDVIIRYSELGYEIDILGADPKSLAVSRYYREKYLQLKNSNKPAGSEEGAHVMQYSERAANFINCLKQRRLTLAKIVKYLAEKQHSFITTGSYLYLKPMTRLQMSAEIGLHESTISRATMRKFVLLPNKELIPFEIFFKPSLRIQKVIEQLLENENPSKPMSDEQIAIMLSEQGINVARRTINKYRSQSKILSSRLR